jgi:hypothetical protein
VTRTAAAGVLLAKKLWKLIPKKILRLLLLTLLVVGASAWGVELKGTVINGTTKRPSAGDEVVLLTLSEAGMSESARTTTDGSGHFRFSLEKTQASYLLRVVHEHVNYHRMAEAGLKPVAVAVYDVAEKLDGVTAIMEVERLEATGETLEIKQLVTVRNDSRPPRTLVKERTFEIQLPPEAQVESGLVQVEDGQPLKQKPVAGEPKGQYYFASPIRPGDTRFAVVYQLPYNGKALIEPTIRNPQERFVVMLPKSMKFEPRTAGIFHSMPDTTPDNVQGTGPVRPGQTMAFRISGTGTLEELRGRRQQAQDSQLAGQKGRPGGGLGPPIDAPDPLEEYRWPILGGLAALLVAGAVYVKRKTRLRLANEYRSVVRAEPYRPAKQQTRSRMRGRNRGRVRV